MAAGLFGGGGQALIVGGESGRGVDADAAAEGVIGIFGREGQARIAGSRRRSASPGREGCGLTRQSFMVK